jgi:urea transport system permease protein
MKSLIQRCLLGIAACWIACGSLGAVPASGTEAQVRSELARAIASKGAEQQQLLNELADSGSPIARQVLTAWPVEEIYWYGPPSGPQVPVMMDEQQDAQGRARAIRIDTGEFVTDAKGDVLRIDPSTLNPIETDMQLAGRIQQTLDMLSLSDPDPDARQTSVVKLGSSGRLSYVPILQARLGKERVASIRKSIEIAIATLELGAPDPATQVAGAEALGRLDAIGSLATLTQLASSPSAKPEVVQAAKATIGSIDRHIEIVNFYGTVFRGLSLGSILLVVALGLAITFGLMGVINMAHGEMVAVGAYTCYVVQNLFGTGFSFSINLPFSFFGRQLGFGLSLPGLHATGWVYGSYFLVALPLSFVSAALAGAVLERAVIRFLYRRPLESLLATWGVSLVLQQLFRMVFGANNVQVDSPSWMIGHFTLSDVIFDYNRIFVIGFAVVIVWGTWLLLSKTPLGLLIRSVMQNRSMAACMGVRTERVNLLTFAFGSGLAGLAGAFISQIGNVGPSLGQTYIVDSFMTVVVGGVGSIVGTVCSALGIGTADEVLQQVLGSPVVGKILVLAAIILFLQWKPGGLFTSRSRNLD